MSSEATEHIVSRPGLVKLVWHHPDAQDVRQTGI